MDNKQWLEGLKKGDKVAIPVAMYDGSGRKQYQIETVMRVTKTLVILRRGQAEGARYSRLSGRSMYGSPWSMEVLTEPTEKIIAAYNARVRRGRVEKALTCATDVEIARVLEVLGAAYDRFKAKESAKQEMQA